MQSNVHVAYVWKDDTTPAPSFCRRSNCSWSGSSTRMHARSHLSSFETGVASTRRGLTTPGAACDGGMRLPLTAGRAPSLIVAKPSRAGGGESNQVMRYSKPFAAAVGFAVLAFAGVATAQTEDERYNYHFDDDLMVGDTFSTPPPLLRLRTKQPRIMLLRPRASFVGEMLKSVEVL